MVSTISDEARHSDDNVGSSRSSRHGRSQESLPVDIQQEANTDLTASANDTKEVSVHSGSSSAANSAKERRSVNADAFSESQGSRARKLSPGGKLSIVFSVPRENHDDRMQMDFDLQNPDFVVDRMLERLANRFPPETVVTIAPMSAVGMVESGDESDYSVSDSLLSDIIGVSVFNLPYVVFGIELHSAFTAPALASVGYAGVTPLQVVLPHMPSTGVVVTSVPIGDLQFPAVLTADGCVIIGCDKITTESGDPAVVTDKGKTIVGIKHVWIAGSTGTMPAVILANGQVARGERHVLADGFIPGVETSDGRVIEGERHAFVSDEGFIVSKASSSPNITHHSAILTSEGYTIIGERHFFTDVGKPAISIGGRVIEGLQHTTVASVPGALPAVVIEDGRIIIGKRHGVNVESAPVIITSSNRELQGHRHVFVSPESIAAGLIINVPAVISKEGNLITGAKVHQPSRGPPVVIQPDNTQTEGVSVTTLHSHTGAIPALVLNSGEVITGERHTATADGRAALVTEDGVIYTGVSHTFVSSDFTSISSMTDMTRDVLESLERAVPGIMTSEGYLYVDVTIQSTSDGITKAMLSDGSQITGHYVIVNKPAGALPCVVKTNGDVVEGTKHVLDPKRRPAVLTAEGKVVSGERQVFVDKYGKVSEPITDASQALLPGIAQFVHGMMTPDGRVVVGDDVITTATGEKAVRMPDGSIIEGIPVVITAEENSIPCVVDERGNIIEGVKHVIDSFGRPAVVTESGKMIHGIRHAFKTPDGRAPLPITLRDDKLQRASGKAVVGVITPKGQVYVGDDLETSPSGGVSLRLSDGRRIVGMPMAYTIPDEGIPCIVKSNGDVIEGVKHVVDSKGRPAVITVDGKTVSGDRQVFVDKYGRVSEPMTAASHPRVPGIGQMVQGVMTADGRVIIGDDVITTPNGEKAVRMANGDLVKGRLVMVPKADDSVPCVIDERGNVIQGVKHGVDSTGRPTVILKDGTTVTGERHAFKRKHHDVPLPCLIVSSHDITGAAMPHDAAAIGVLTRDGYVYLGNCIEAGSNGTHFVRLPKGLAEGREVYVPLTMGSNSCVVNEKGDSIIGIRHVVDANGSPAIITPDGKVMAGVRHSFQGKHGGPASPLTHVNGPSIAGFGQATSGVITLDGRVIIGALEMSPTGEKYVQITDGRQFKGKPLIVRVMSGAVPCVKTASGEIIEGAKHIVSADGWPGVLLADDKQAFGERQLFKEKDGSISPIMEIVSAGVLERKVALSDTAVGALATPDGRLYVSSDLKTLPNGNVVIRLPDGTELAGSPVFVPLTRGAIPCVVKANGDVIEGVKHVIDSKGSPAVITNDGRMVSGERQLFRDKYGNVSTPMTDDAQARQLGLSQMAKGIMAPDGTLIIGDYIVTTPTGAKAIVLPNGDMIEGRPIAVPKPSRAVPCVVDERGNIIEGMKHVVDSSGRPAVITKDGKIIPGIRHAFKGKDGKPTRPIPIEGHGISDSVCTSNLCVTTPDGRVIIGDILTTQNGGRAVRLPNGDLVEGQPGCVLQADGALPCVVDDNGNVTEGVKHVVDSQGRPAVVTKDGKIVPGKMHAFRGKDGKVLGTATLPDESRPNDSSSATLGVITFDGRLIVSDSNLETTPTGEKAIRLPDGKLITGRPACLTKPTGSIPCVIDEFGVVVEGVKHVVDSKGRPAVLTKDGKTVSGERHSFKGSDHKLAKPMIVQIDQEPLLTGLTGVVTKEGHVIIGDVVVTPKGGRAVRLPTGDLVEGRPVCVPKPEGALPCVLDERGNVTEGVKHIVDSQGRPAVVTKDGRTVTGEIHAFRGKDDKVLGTVTLPDENRPDDVSSAAMGVITSDGRLILSDFNLETTPTGEKGVRLPDGKLVTGRPVCLARPDGSIPCVVDEWGNVVEGVKHVIDYKGRNSKARPAVVTKDGKIVPGQRHAFKTKDGKVGRPIPLKEDAIPNRFHHAKEGKSFHGSFPTEGHMDVTVTSTVTTQQLHPVLDGVRALITREGCLYVGHDVIPPMTGQEAMRLPDGRTVQGTLVSLGVADGAARVLITSSGEVIEGLEHVFDQNGRPAIRTADGRVFGGERQTFKNWGTSLAQPLVVRHDAVVHGALRGVKGILTGDGRVFEGSFVVNEGGRRFVRLHNGTIISGRSVVIPVGSESIPCVITTTGEVVQGVKHDVDASGNPAIITSSRKMVVGIRHAFLMKDGSTGVPHFDPYDFDIVSRVDNIYATTTQQPIRHESFKYVPQPHETYTTPTTFERERVHTQGSTYSRVLSEQLLGEAPEKETIRYVEVPVIQEVIREVPVKQTIYTEKRVPIQHIEWVERTVEVPHIEYIDKQVEVPEVREVIRHVTKKEVRDVPKEYIRHVPKIEHRVVEKIVEIPGQIIEVPKPYTVEQKVTVNKLRVEEVPTVVAQKILPCMLESDEIIQVDVRTLEPKLVPIDVYVPVPVSLPLLAGAKIAEYHQCVDIPGGHWNSLVKVLNAGDARADEFAIWATTASGTIPMLPINERVDIVPPVKDDWISSYKQGRFAMSEGGHSVDMHKITGGRIEEKNIQFVSVLEHSSVRGMSGKGKGEMITTMRGAKLSDVGRLSVAKSGKSGKSGKTASASHSVKYTTSGMVAPVVEVHVGLDEMTQDGRISRRTMTQDDHKGMTQDDRISHGGMTGDDRISRGGMAQEDYASCGMHSGVVIHEDQTARVHEKKRHKSTKHNRKVVHTRQSHQSCCP